MMNSKEDIKQLNEDFFELIDKHRENISSGLITTEILRNIVTITVFAAIRHGELPSLEVDLCGIIKNQIDNTLSKLADPRINMLLASITNNLQEPDNNG